MKKIIFGFLVLSVCSVSYSQEKNKKEKKEKDKAYVEKIKALFSLRPFVQQNIDLLTFNYKNSNDPALLYRPATGINVGGSVSLSFLSFSYQRNLPLFQPAVPDTFEAKHQRIGFDLGGNILGFSFDYQQNNGFFIWNGTEHLDTSLADPGSVLYREDIQSRTIGTSFRFTFSNKLSQNALFDQSQRQLKSKAAFCLILGNRFHGFKAADPFIPNHRIADYPLSGKLNVIWINNTFIMPGYGFIGVKGYWNVGAFIYSGSGLQVRKHFSAMDDGWSFRFPLMGKFKGGVSYNGKFFYAKLFAMADYIKTGFKESKSNWLQTSWEFSLGFRLYGKKDK
jgi:hypothetical protein